MRRGLFMVACVTIMAGCGKRGALIYPDMLVPAAPEAISASQSGNEIKLSFVLPGKDRAGRSLKDLAGVKVLRRETGPRQEALCNSCSDDFQLFRQLYLDAVDGSMAQRFDNMVIMRDSNVSTDATYTYRLIPFTRDSIDGAASEPVSVKLAPPVPAPRLQAVPAPTEISLSILSEKPVSGEIAGYNIYRTEKGHPYSWLPLNSKPLPSGAFTDERLRRHVIYNYSARSIVRMPGGALAESSRSNEVEVQLQDD